jgi:hypothetical protein
MIRKRLVSAAVYVLDRLKAASVVSTSASNISLDAASETFYPDLLLIDESRGQVIIVELKKSRQTERQALTELLAYEHEVKNYLPFLSDLDLCFVLIATEFGPLLEHSVAALTTWESKQILCLKADPSAGMPLSIHVPGPWTAIGQHPLAENALPTLTVRLDVQNRDDSQQRDRLLKVLVPAVELIAREGDRVRSHGFAMLWGDTWAGRVTESEFCITIGLLNPFVFLPDAIRLGMLPTPKTAFARFILADDRLSELTSAFGPFRAIAEKALVVLGDYSSPEWELDCDWRALREFSSPIRHRAVPIHFDSWGSIGEYTRELVAHPAARRNFMPELQRRALNWHDRAVAVPVLDQIAGVSLFDAGEFWCSDLFYFGARLNALTTACSMLKNDPKTVGSNVEAFFEWAKLDIVSALREISATELTVPPPTVLLRPPEDAGEMIPEIEALARWMDREFLGDVNEVHRRFFRLGLETFPLLYEGLQTKGNATLLEEARVQAVEASREFLASLVQDIDGATFDSDVTEKLRVKIASAFSKPGEQIPLAEKVRQASPEILLRNYPELMLEATDELFPSAMHQLALPASMEVVDWEWLKEQISKLRSQGAKYPAIQLNPDGAFVTTILDEHEGAMLRPMDPQTEVFFINNFSGFALGLITEWEDLVSGSVFKPDMPHAH